MKINSAEEIEDWPGVYAIINKTNGREYVGSSEKGILSRINQHERLLKTGKHNRKEMQEDYNNGDVFEAEIIFILPIGGTRKQLLSREIEEIKKRGAKTRLYNAPNWAIHRNPQTGKLEKIEYTGSYYLPRQYLGGAWDNGRDSEIVPRRNGNDADLVKFKITPAIRAAAAAAGQSLQGYILQAVRARMEQEGQPLEIDPAESGEEGGTIGGYWGRVLAC